MGIVALTKDEELDLARRWANNGDKAAFDRLVLAHVRLASHYAWRVRRFGDFDDMKQIAIEGLIVGLRHFSPERNLRVCTYVTWWIRAHLTQAIDDRHMVNALTTAGRQKASRHTARVRAKLISEQRDSTDADVARELGVKVADVNAAVATNLPLLVINEQSIHGALAASTPDPEFAVGMAEASRAAPFILERAMAKLRPIERYVIEQRFRDDRTLNEIALELGTNHLGLELGGNRRSGRIGKPANKRYSREGVRLIERRALDALACIITAEQAIALGALEF